MNVNQLNDLLTAYSNTSLHFKLPSGELVPEHFHVTEVGRIQKSFIDCGGARRESVSCQLQVWSADDVEHRLSAAKLQKILALAGPSLAAKDLPVEVEYGAEIASQYVLGGFEIERNRLVLVLKGKKTDCLARDKCGVGGCSTSGCCR